MFIRVAEEADLPTVAKQFVDIQRAHVLAYPFRYNKISLVDAQSILEERLDSPGFYVAELDNKVVGYVVYDIVYTEQTKVLRERQYCYLQQVGVDSSARETGVGLELIRHVKTECQIKGVNDIELDVWAFNAGAYKFFEKAGFEQYGYKMKLSNNK